jgi:hypothetical protein
LFFIVHIAQVIKAGWNNFRAMVTGFEVIGVDDSSPASSPLAPTPAASPLPTASAIGSVSAPPAVGATT